MPKPLATLLALCLCLAARAEPEVLPNGVRLVLRPDAQAGAVALLAIYDTGFVDDPPSLAQAAHLVEHLRCTGATASFEPGASFARLNTLGAANAETLLATTYYDAIVPPEHLDLALTVEAERLTTLRVEAPDVAREGPRAAAEVDAVLSFPSTPLGKFAQMAAVQAWFHARDDARVRTGLESADARALADLARTRHAPGSLTVVLVGSFDEASARDAVARILGSVPPRNPAPRAPADLSRAPASVTWDVDAFAVALAATPPDDPLARSALTLLGMHLMTATRGVEGVASSIASTHAAPVGDAPFHLIAVLAPGADPDAVAERLHDAVDAALARPAPVRALGATLASQPTQPDAASLDRAVAQMRARGTDPARARTLVLANAALQDHLRERSIPASHARRLAEMTDDQLRALVGGALVREARVVTRFAPADDPG